MNDRTLKNIDEREISTQPAMSRRDVLKRLGAGSLAMASAAVLSPVGADAAYTASLIDLVLGIDKSGTTAKVKVYYTLSLGKTALAEIRSGKYRYGIWFSLYKADGKLIHAWSSGPLPAQALFRHSTSQSMNWKALRGHGTTFYARAHVYKKRLGSENMIRVSQSNFTLNVRL